MSHILIKWVEEAKWDVYPVKSLADPAIGIRLLTEEGAIKQLKGSVVSVFWKEGEQPAKAELLYLGKQASLEKKRAKLAAEAPECVDRRREDSQPSAGMSTCNEHPCCRSAAQQLKEQQEEISCLRNENESLKRQLEAAEKIAVQHSKMVCSD
ncbi:uncharacterized protein LOC144132487 [Amblyomma americanum]